MTLFQSDTVQLTRSRQKFNRPPLDWTARKRQTQGTREYSPLMYNLRHTVAADIALPMDTVTIGTTRVEVALNSAWLKQQYIDFPWLL